MTVLNPTPPELLVDKKGRPYFLWDTDMDLETFRDQLHDPDPAVRGYLAGKLMRQAKPDDVFTFLSLAEIEELWPHLQRYLGKRRDLWTWLLEEWGLKLDLVAEPVPGIEPPQPLEVGGATILVDTPHEILVNKLCAVLGRSELRDLQDIQALLAAGGDLIQALQDAPRKDGGFSALILADLLRHLPIEAMARTTGDPSADLLAFRDELVTRLVEASRPAEEE